MKTFKRKTTYNASNDRQTDRLWLTEIVKYVAKKKQIKEENIKCRLFMVPSFSLERQHNNNKNITTTRKY